MSNNAPLCSGANSQNEERNRLRTSAKIPRCRDRAQRDRSRDNCAGGQANAAGLVRR